MRLMPVLTFALALAIAFSMITLSGFGAQIGYDPQTGIDDEFDEVAGEGDDEDSMFGFDPDEGGDSLLGSTVAAMYTLRDIASVLVYLPSSLETIGFPSWAARLVGHSAQIILALGFAQVVRGFEIR